MTPPAKSAALRAASSGDLEPSDGVEQARSRILPPRPVNRPPARPGARSDDRLVSFPSFEASRAPRKPAPAPAASETAPDLGAELEAALMNDLESMVALFDQAARDGNAPDPRAEPSTDPDQEALERLLTSIRQGDGAPREAALPASVAPVVAVPEPEPAIEIAAEIAPPPRRPASPRPEGRENRLAPPSPRQRKPRPDAANDSGTGAKVAARPAPQRPPRAAPIPPLTEPSERRSYLKPAIAASALILLAAIGAGMTIRALTATSEPTPTETAAAAPATAAPAETSSAETSVAKTSAAETSVAAAPTAPETSAAPAPTDSGATAATSDAPVRMAADNSADAPSAPATAMAPAATAEASPAPVRMAEAAAPAETASSAAPIPMTAPAPEPVAEPEVASAEPLPAVSEPETAAPDLSASEAPPVAEAPVAAAPKAIASIPAGSSSGGLQPGAATIASGVNLRSNPDNGAPVIGVLKTGTGVEIVGCKIWCEIVAGDKRGFVFQKFLSQS